MSPTKLNSLLTGAFFAIIIALSSSVVASDLRFFKPYGPDSFGGGRRVNDGVYGSVSGIYWSFSTPEGGYIGATTAKGNDEKRWVYDVSGNAYLQTNTERIGGLSPGTTLGTRFEVGNRYGHNGWLVSGYGLPDQGHGLRGQNVTMAIRDEANFSLLGNTALTPYVWDRQQNVMREGQYVNGRISGIGYLYGEFDVFDDTDTLVGREYAPLPIWFEDVNISIRSSHRSAELMYTYRPHPFTWGSMELLAGVRYWDFEDTFSLRAGPSETSVLTFASAFTRMAVNADANNCVFGPQVGLKLFRHNARWTFGAEGRLTAGINSQHIKIRGSVSPDDSIAVPIGAQNGNRLINDKQRKTYFSPILEGRLSADWQWTNAVSFFGAVEGMFADNIARGVRVTDYVVKSDGTIFGIRGNDRNTHVFVYGVELGVKLRR